MGWNIRSRLGRCLRLITRVLCYGFLLSLPITFFPVIWGVQGGIKFHFWFHRQIEENTNAMTFEIEQDQRLSYWNVPGAQTIHQFQDNKAPFHIPQLRLVDWMEKLELGKPDLYPEEDPGIDRMANLDDLVRTTGLNEQGAPTEYWVYITFMPEYSSSAWDAAFSEILQKTNFHPLRPEVAVYYLDCLKSQFLCGVWGVKQPSLVHFTVSPDTLADLTSDDTSSYSTHLTHQYACPAHQLHPVSARIIELPLSGDDAVPFLPRNTLPTPLLQLRTLLLDAPHSAILEHFDPWDPLRQTLRRFQDLIDDLVEQEGTFWHRLNVVDRWYTDGVLEPLLGKELCTEILTQIQGFVFTVVWLATEVARIPFYIGWWVYSWYFGLGWDGEPMGTHVWPGSGEEGDGNGQGDTMFGDMMAGFWEFAAEKMAAQSVEEAAQAAVTERA
jgi:hypothetical protein